jgi:hypothetical protein
VLFDLRLHNRFVQKNNKNNYRVAMTNMTWQRKPTYSVGVITNTSCWNNVSKI